MCDCWFPLLRVVVVCLFTEREVIAGGRRRSFIAAGSATRAVSGFDVKWRLRCRVRSTQQHQQQHPGNRSQQSQQTRRHPDNNYGWHCVGRRTGERLFSFLALTNKPEISLFNKRRKCSKIWRNSFTQRMLLNCQLKEFGASASWRCWEEFMKASKRNVMEKSKNYLSCCWTSWKYQEGGRSATFPWWRFYTLAGFYLLRTIVICTCI